MEPTSLLVFCSALFLAAASPGPGIAAIVGRVLGRGAKGALAFTAGMAVGDVVWLTLAICGLAVLAQTFHVIFLGVKWAGVAYLLLLALKMWTSPAVASAVMPDRRRERPTSLFFGGLALSMGNPKVMIFYVAFLPTMMDITSISVLGYVILVFATLGVLTLVFGIYVVLATRARLLFTSSKALQIVNRSSATVMTGAAAWVASR
jgi:threonine/homoserine/homoserine lactone efflux protein